MREPFGVASAVRCLAAFHVVSHWRAGITYTAWKGGLQVKFNLCLLHHFDTAPRVTEVSIENSGKETGLVQDLKGLHTKTQCF